MLVIGLVILALGVLGCIFWWPLVWPVVLSLVIIALVLLGLLLVVLAISEFAGPRDGQAPEKAAPDAKVDGE
ncbi:MAG TPA: hypothetical protein VGM23_11845 [Armatimonadota bacterium]